MTPEEKKAYHKAYYQKNKAKWQGPRKWAIDNPEKNQASKAAYKARNKDKVKAYNKAWAKANAGKVTAYAQNYKLLKQKRIPAWLPQDQLRAITEFYASRPEGQHVDHIVPLNSKLVSGLHVPWNLQYLPATENIRKSNKI